MTDWFCWDQGKWFREGRGAGLTNRVEVREYEDAFCVSFRHVFRSPPVFLCPTRLSAKCVAATLYLDRISEFRLTAWARRNNFRQCGNPTFHRTDEPLPLILGFVAAWNNNREVPFRLFLAGDAKKVLCMDSGQALLALDHSYNLIDAYDEIYSLLQQN